MINLIFFVFAFLGLVILQTVIIPDFSWFPHCFDLMIINIMYLSLFSQRYWVPFCLVIIGSIMDSLSGSPFFLHTTAYLCIYLIVFFLRKLVFQRSAVFILIVSVASACIYQVLVMFSLFLLQDHKVISAADYRLCIGQIIWAVVGIPTGVWFMKLLHHNFSHAVKLTGRHITRKYRG